MARTRWSVVVSSQTDQALQMFLASQGRRKGDRSRFIEEAVRAHLFALSAQETKAANAGISEAHLGAIVDQALGLAKNSLAWPRTSKKD